MIFTQHYLACLSHASYVIGDPTTGRAVVVHPRRDVEVYLDEAAQHGLTIEGVIETHVHADFLSGHLERAASSTPTRGKSTPSSARSSARRARSPRTSSSPTWSGWTPTAPARRPCSPARTPFSCRPRRPSRRSRRSPPTRSGRTPASARTRTSPTCSTSPRSRCRWARPTAPFGVTVFAPAFADQVGIDVAARLTGEQVHEPYPGTWVDLVVFGAHLRGEPLNPHLGALGARFDAAVRTAPEYRMVLVADGPPRPGIVRCGPGGGVSLPGERWTLSPAALGAFLAGLPAPMSLGSIALDDGTTAVGLGCDLATAQDAVDISAYEGWRAYLHR